MKFLFVIIVMIFVIQDTAEYGNWNAYQPKKSQESQKLDEDGNVKVNPYSKIQPEKAKRREILSPESEIDIFEEQEQATQSDWKKTPTWDIAYKQLVTASDVFLQMSFKNTATASCEDMIVTIHLPEENRHNVDLKIVKDKLTLISPKFYLNLPLPQTVDPQKGNAQFDSESEKLIITLRMDRELDHVNF